MNCVMVPTAAGVPNPWPDVRGSAGDHTGTDCATDVLPANMGWMPTPGEKVKVFIPKAESPPPAKDPKEREAVPVSA